METPILSSAQSKESHQGALTTFKREKDDDEDEEEDEDDDV